MLDAERRAVVAHLDDLADLTPGTTGNLSVRDGDRIAVTPSGMAYDEVSPADVPVVGLDGERVAGDRDPSSETPLHTRLYRERDVGAVVHTHSPWATTLAVQRESLPAVHYMLARVGGAVPLAEYATYGTEALADGAVAAMERAEADACLLANHGLVVTGADLETAVADARTVESVARIHCQAEAMGSAVALDAEEMAAVAEKFDEYGQG